MASGQVVLVLGAGMVCPPLVKYLDDKGYTVIVASRTLKKAEEVCKGCKRAQAKQLDAESTDDVGPMEALIKEASAVISLLPYLLHTVPARLALKHGKHFMTTSYVSADMKTFDAEAKAKGLVFINECGVDPGMDHMSACKVFHEIAAKKGKLISFKSYCGGLPAPDDNNNPMGYKFSWAPRGVLLAARNSAKFLLDGKEVSIPNSRLFKDIEIIEVPPMGKYEATANRDSLSYIDTYSVQGVQTMKRGTLRNLKWCATLDRFVELDLLSLEVDNTLNTKTYAEVMAQVVGAPDSKNVKEAVAKKLGLALTDKPITDMEWLGLFSSDRVPSSVNTRLDMVAQAMLPRMQYAPGEKDMLLMKHEFVVEYPDRREYLSSTMVDIGKPNGATSMSTTVSIPVAIACNLVLSGKFTTPGIQTPVIPELYKPILQELAQMGIEFRESVDKVEKIASSSPPKRAKKN
eukprot:RCo010678